MAATSTFIHILIAISFCHCQASSYPVPLLIWSTKSVDVDDEILAGHTLNYEDVQVKYLDKLKAQSNTICLFVQDKLSIDDFAANPGMDLKHLKDVLHSSPTSIVLPSVSLEQDFEEGKKNNKLVEYLETTSHGVVIPLTPEGVTDFPDRIKSLRTDVPTVIIVHLPKAKTGEDSMRNLEPSDEIIGKVSDLLSSHFPDYVALLTADMPRDDVQSGMAAARQLSVSHARERRSTADDKKKLRCNQTGVLVAKDGLMMYMTNMYLYGRGGNTSDTFINTTNEVLPTSVIKLDNSSGLMLSFQLKGVFINGSDISMK
ncbi:V-type proton ATPase subunit S1-like [Paramuricea clavata]|uniref:V-type proton ATPase subunit S1-like n=1 Tax=Paramuricea clavata TaxID=317549 RepID=A0A6S7IBB2_PARCT|nr:V-type proton ATPase subunit S1-like [Paramuricea clavata]